MVEPPASVADAWNARLAGALDAHGASELLHWFERNPDALASARREAAIDLALSYSLAPADARLRDAVTARLRGGAEPATAPFAARVMTRVRRRRQPRAAPWPWLAAAASIAALVAVLVMARGYLRPAPASASGSAPTVEAAASAPQHAVGATTITALRGTVQLGTQTLTLGRAVPLLDEIQIVVADEGAASVQAADGSLLALEGAAALDRSHGQWRLARGLLSVDAAPQPPGEQLTITTRRGVVSVIGTRFRVEADSDRTWVQVERGHVALAQSTQRRELAPGQEAVADADGVSAPATAQERRVLAPADGAVSNLFDTVHFSPVAGSYHGLPLARFDYPESTRRHGGFADVSWTVSLRTGERHLQAWFRPELVLPKPGNAGTIIALVAAMDGCDYVLAERLIAPEERGWVRIDGDFAHARLNWTRGEPAPPLNRSAICSVSFRAYSGFIAGTLAAPALLP